MGAKFEVTACRSDHAGKAHVAFAGSDGTEIRMDNLPFEDRSGGQQAQEQQRILIQAARIARELADFVSAQSKGGQPFPTQAPKPGPAPRAQDTEVDSGASAPRRP